MNKKQKTLLIRIIIAAVLFGVVYMFGNMGMIWLWIAAAYLVMGIMNLVVYAIKSSRKQKAAAKAEAAAEEA